MTRLLGVVSSTAVVGVALGVAGVDGVEVVDHDRIATDRRHAEELTPMVARLLERSGWRALDVDRFAVDVGPGRFTGLRVGLATVRALALAAGAPVVGISSLELLASVHPGRVWSVVDARRAEVFQQGFLDGVAVTDAVVGAPGDLATLVGGDDLVVGDGADRYGEIYGHAGTVAGCEPDPSTLVRLAAVRPAVPGPEVAPRYLRDADVQINIRTRHDS